jgi:hypothetical protein
MPTFDRSKIVRGLAQGQILVPYLNRVLADFDEEWGFEYNSKEGDDGWHPSGDCVPPVTELYAQATGQVVLRSFGPNTHKSFMVGHFWHQWLQYIVLEKLGLCDESAIERKGSQVWGTIPNMGGPRMKGLRDPYHYVTGTGDIAPLVTPKWRGIVDIKTMSTAHFNEPGLPERYANTYLCQINIYMHLFEEERALILAVQKDSPHELKEFEFVRDDALINAILDKWRFVSQCIDEGWTPTKNDDATHKLPLKG